MNKKPYCNNLLNQIDAVLYQPCVLKTYSKVVFSTAEKLYGETLEHQIQIIDFFFTSHQLRPWRNSYCSYTTRTGICIEYIYWLFDKTLLYSTVQCTLYTVHCTDYST